MTANLYTITPTPPTTLALKTGEEGKFSFTITSLAAPDTIHQVMLQAQLIDGDKGKEVDWLVVGPQRLLSLAGGKTETVTITVRAVTDTPQGDHRIKLILADKDKPNDVFAESPPVSCTVGQKAAPPPPGPSKQWLLPVLIAAGLLVVGGVLLFLLRPQGIAGPPGPPGPAGTPGTAGPPGPPGSGAQSAVWTGFVYHNSTPAPADGRVASFSFTPSATGFVNVTAHYGLRVLTNGTTDCHIESLLDTTARKNFSCDTTRCSTSGYDDLWLNGNLPTQRGAGTFLALHQSMSRVFPVSAGGATTIFLSGLVSTSCAAIWGPITMTAEYFASNPSATLTAP